MNHDHINPGDPENMAFWSVWAVFLAAFVLGGIAVHFLGLGGAWAGGIALTIGVGVIHAMRGRA